MERGRVAALLRVQAVTRDALLARATAARDAARGVDETAWIAAGCVIAVLGASKTVHVARQALAAFEGWRNPDHQEAALALLDEGETP